MLMCFSIIDETEWILHLLLYRIHNLGVQNYRFLKIEFHFRLLAQSYIITVGLFVNLVSR